MTLRVYNTLTRQKELFQPVRAGKVGMYLCGPTVYKPPHIGHMVGPVIFDAIKRYLQFKGFEVTWVVNITDVEDKLIDAAAKLKTDVLALAERYSREYLDCLKSLGVESIDRFPKASDHIKEIIEICQRLIDTGYAYAAEGNVYFDVAKDSDYGKLSNRKVQEQEAGTRFLEAAGKRNPADFALWKSAKPGEPMWESPWGNGRPGWHIECSAMSMKYLGDTLDIHGGGMDLIFPHHENELAQSESATGKPFAKYWLHNGLTRLNTKKMSGSEGNVIAARGLIDQYGAELLRYMLLTTHYRSPIEFTEDVVSAAGKGLAAFTRLFERIGRLNAPATAEKPPDIEALASNWLETDQGSFVRTMLALKMKFMESMDDDFNTAGAIGTLHEMAGEANSFIERGDIERTKNADLTTLAAAGAQTIRSLGSVLGLFSTTAARPQRVQDGLVDQLMKLLITLRQEARQSKNFDLADVIRTRLADMGVTLEDRPDGTIWRRS